MIEDDVEIHLGAGRATHARHLRPTADFVSGGIDLDGGVDGSIAVTARIDEHAGRVARWISEPAKAGPGGHGKFGADPIGELDRIVPR